ncbi:MAG TPA: ROK family protein [Caldilineae bacterium]|nr:ROK family protein [Caldilineae bacterium]
MAEYFLTVDLGGTQIRAALCDAEGHIHRRANELTRAAEGRAAVIRRIKETMAKALGDVPSSRVRGIGIAAPGPLDPKRGIIIFAPNLHDWHNVPLRQIIQDHFGIPTFLGNDANLAALGEQRFGAGRGVHNLIYITVSTGIGGGIICDDRLLLGEGGFAAEIGHHTIKADGPRCNCGNVGCLEMYASGPAIARMAREAITSGERSLLQDMSQGDLEQITGKMVYEAALKEDPLAIEVLRRAGQYLGVGIVNLLHLFNPAMIIIGGSVAKAGDFLFQPMWEIIRQRSHPSYWEDLRIVPPELGDDVGLLGALALVLSEVQERTQVL